MKREALLASLLVSVGASGAWAKTGRPSLPNKEANMTLRDEIIGPLILRQALLYARARAQLDALLDDRSSDQNLLEAFGYERRLQVTDVMLDRLSTLDEEHAEDDSVHLEKPGQDSTRSAEAALEIIDMMKQARAAKERPQEK